MLATRRIKLCRMPHDKVVDGNFIHATGYEVLVDDEWLVEYQGEEYQDSDDCILEYEEEVI